MADSPGWRAGVDQKRIKRLLAQSEDVLAAARHDLEDHQSLIDRSRSTGSEERKLSPEKVTYERIPSAQRRRAFRQLLRTPEGVTSRAQERSHCLHVEDKATDEPRRGEEATDLTDHAQRQDSWLNRLQPRSRDKDNKKLRSDVWTDRRQWRRDQEEARNGEEASAFADHAPCQDSRFSRQRLQTRSRDIDNTKLRKRDVWTDRRRWPEQEEASTGEEIPDFADYTPRQEPRLKRQGLAARSRDRDNQKVGNQDERTERRRRRRDQETGSLAKPSWTERLNYLTNVITVILAAALLMFWTIRVINLDLPADQGAVVATVGGSHTNAQQTSLLAPLRHPAQGFDIVPQAFPEPLPAFPADISAILFLTRPSLASAPGVVVFPYADLPQALPAFPQDIGSLIFFATPRRPLAG